MCLVPVYPTRENTDLNYAFILENFGDPDEATVCHPTWIKLFQNARYRRAKCADPEELLLFVLVYIYTCRH